MRENDVNKIIGKNIRIQRSLKGYSQEALGKLLGITFQQVQKYEKGANSVAPEKLLQLSSIFGCGVEELFIDPAAAGKNGIANVPGRRSLHLIQNFEHLGQELQKRVGDLVNVLAHRSSLDKEDS